MTANKIISNCQFCSIVSKSNGEDPIGTAYPFDTLIVMEIFQSWIVDVACARFGYPIYRQLRDRFGYNGLRVWRCSQKWEQQFAPTLIDLPNGQV